jgi:hypothetical protein
MINRKKLFRFAAVVFVTMTMLGVSLSSCKWGSKSGMKISGTENFADSSLSTVRLLKDEKGREVLEKDNTYYELVDFIDKSEVRKIMLKINKNQVTYLDSNISKSQFVISATGIGDSKINWSIDAPGADIDYSNGVLIAHIEGRNSDEEDTYTLYSLLNGAKLMTYTYGQLTALIPNTSHKRFFGYLSKLSVGLEKPEGFAMVSYVSSEAVINKVSIKLKAGKTFPSYTPELKIQVLRDSGNTLMNEGKTVIMGHADRNFATKDINNFALQINYILPNDTLPISILLPVRDDKVDVKNAAYDKGIFEVTESK